MTIQSLPSLAELRALQQRGDDPAIDVYELEAHRAAYVERAERIIGATAGRTRSASDERQFTAALEAVDVIDAICRNVGSTERRARERRATEAASLRMAHPHIFGDTPTASGPDFGRRLADAIGEVREGRSVAYVDAPEQRTITEAASGGYAVATQFAGPVSTMTAKSVVMGLPGLRVVPMNSDRIRFPRLGSVTVAGIGEASALSTAASELDAVDIVAEKYGVLEKLSSEFVEDASFDALDAFGSNLLKHLGLRVDLGLLEGTGAADTVGIRNVVGANSTSMAGTPTFAKIRTTEYELLADNGTPACWVMHPRSWNSLAGIVTGIASDTTTVLEPNPQVGPKTLLSHPVYFSTQITLTEGTNGSWIGCLDTSQMVVAERRPARLEVSRDFEFDKDTIAVRATWRGGLGVLNPTAVSLLTDVRA